MKKIDEMICASLQQIYSCGAKEAVELHREVLAQKIDAKFDSNQPAADDISFYFMLGGIREELEDERIN